MKLFTPLLIFSCIYFGGCSVSKKSSDFRVDEANLKSGTVLYIPKKTRDGLQTEMELYFKIDTINYFVQFSESVIRPDELKKYIDQTILIEGIIKTGLLQPTAATTLSSNQYPEKIRSGEYITIDKILEKKKVLE
jgi:hypothetical protein